MRIIFTSAFLLALSAPMAVPQESLETTHFLVDRSGSMSPRKSIDPEAEAKATLQSEVDLLENGQWAEVTFFGHGTATIKSGDPCAHTAISTAPRFQGVNDIPQFPNLGGMTDKTNIGAALESVLANAAEDATVVLITDGGEECSSDLKSIREKFPRAEIDVRQVGSKPDTVLELLELKPEDTSRSEQAAPASIQSVEITHKIELDGTANLAWEDANWLERRVWLFALLALAASSWFWGSSFGRRANKYEHGTKAVERIRREMLAKGESSEDIIEKSIPTELLDEVVEHEGTVDSRRSAYSAIVAGVLGLPLIFVEYSYSPMIKWVATAAIFVLLTAFIFFNRRGLNLKELFRRTSSDRNTTRHYSRWLTPLVLFFGVVLSISACWADPNAASAAAWFVLSANFSAAMSIIASAPLLFVGSKWWQFEHAKSEYRYTYSEAISDTLREQRRKQRVAYDRWDTLRQSLTAWKPTKDFSFLGLMFSSFRSAQLKRAQSEVIDYLKNVAQEAAAKQYSPESSDLLHRFNQASKLEDAIRTLLEDETSKKLLMPTEEWDRLANALASKNDGEIATALIGMRRFLS